MQQFYIIVIQITVHYLQYEVQRWFR